VIELDCPIRSYAWGSRSFLATLQGRAAPTPEPEAELWLGAHPGAPALAGGVPLGELVTADPAATLGDVVVSRFGARLPYLLKVLAADEPLSIQVHPDAAAAREGFGIRAGYTDPYPKPELLVALTGFEALCGFRDPAHTADELADLRVPALVPVVETLRTGEVAQRLRAAMSLLLGWPAPERAALVADVVATGHPLTVRLAQRHPADVGVVVALLLNHLRLRPGDAVFMPAGNVHAYLGGAGVEIMGASDNVLRAGLTVKPVDPAELLRLVRYEVLADPIFPATAIGPGLTAWRPPVEEFTLVRGTPPADAPVTLPGDGPRVATCLRGVAALQAGGSAVTLRAGRAVFLAAGEPPLTVTGDTVVFQASPGGAPA
jgi:mannose-6-phosphate isomerase